jgi:hypothetical protein
MRCTAHGSHRKAIIGNAKKPLELKLILAVKPRPEVPSGREVVTFPCGNWGVELRPVGR